MQLQAERLAQVYLVHGTWGRGFRPGKTLLGRRLARPIWSEPGGYFHDDLKEALSAHGFRPRMNTVNWSGSNSVLERDRMAQQLGKRLDEDAAVDPACLQIVIAHSHGGNIALEAARRYRRTETDLHIVTLATPFIDLWTAMNVQEDGRYTEAYGKAFARRAGLTRLRRTVASFTVTVGGFLVAGSVGLLPPIPAMLAQPSFWYVLPFPLVDLLLGLLLTSTGAREDALMRVPRLDAPRVPGLARCRILVLRGTDDEAGMALAGGAIQAILGSGVSRVATFALAILSLFFVPLLALRGVWTHIGLLAILGTLSLFLCGSLLEAIGRSAAGREFLLMGGLVGISVNSAPDAEGDVTVTTLPGSPSIGLVRDAPAGVREWNIRTRDYRFKHGLYAHRDCIPAILRWLQRQT
ncbi:MAG: hypothetical protein JO264_03560 [Acidisphaera sp.]|nr:hypothetical protein [Acidisphaera sp.]